MLGQDLREVISQISASQVQPQDGMRQGKALVNRHSVGHTITRVQHDKWYNPRQTTWMAMHIMGVLKVSNMICVIFLQLALGVQRDRSQRNGVLLRGYTELVVEGVMPDLLGGGDKN